MATISRRDFLAHSTAAVGVLAAPRTMTAAAAPPSRKLTSGADQVTLGRSGVKSSLIGMGTGSVGVKRSSNQVKLGQEKFTKLWGTPPCGWLGGICRLEDGSTITLGYRLDRRGG